MGLIDSLFSTRKTEFTFGRLGPDPGTLVQKEAAYLNVLLLSCRIINVRKGLRKFYGAVHSQIDFDARSSLKPRATVTTVTTPALLNGIDAANLDKVITLTQRLLGPVPYRGGDLQIEAGLFSVKEADLAGPFLDVLGELSSAAGTSILSAALPFAGPLVKGFNLLAGAPDTAGLEIGVSDTWVGGTLRTGTFVVMRAPAGSIDLTKLRLDTSNRIVDASGAQLKDFPYFVYEVSASRERDDFFNIPDLAKTHEEIQAAIRNGKDDEARNLLAMFRRLAMTSPDLLSKDGLRLAKLVEDELVAVIGSATHELGRATVGRPVATARQIRSLREVPLFSLS